MWNRPDRDRIYMLVIGTLFFILVMYQFCRLVVGILWHEY